MDATESVALLRDYSFYRKNFERHVADQGLSNKRTTPPNVCFHRGWDMDELERARDLVELRDKLAKEAEEFRLHI